MAWRVSLRWLGVGLLLAACLTAASDDFAAPFGRSSPTSAAMSRSTDADAVRAQLESFLTAWLGHRRDVTLRYATSGAAESFDADAIGSDRYRLLWAPDCLLDVTGRGSCETVVTHAGSSEGLVFHLDYVDTAHGILIYQVRFVTEMG